MTLAFSLGLAAALLAWGPVDWGTTAATAAASSADELRWAWARWWLAPQVWVAALLFALALWVQFLFASSQRRVCDVVWPWRLLVMLAAVRACLWVAQSGEMASGSLAAIQFSAQLSQAGLGVVLSWGLMAERFKTQYKVWVGCLVCAGLLVVAGLWCLLVPGATTVTHGGDARAFLLLQLLPAVLVAAGVLSLPERGLSRGESMLLIVAYLTTWLTTWLPAWLPVLSTYLVFSGTERLMAALPWASVAALCFLALVPAYKLTQTQRNQLLGSVRSDRRSMAPAWLAHFRFEALAAPDRRHSS